MSISSNKQPIYDERVQDILRGMAEGKTRDELAKELGHKSFKALDIYMRRKNFSWDREKQSYIPATSRSGKKEIETDLIRSSKVASILSLFNKEGADARTIAKRLGFTDHRELAAYMKGKGYRWCSDRGNYVRSYGLIQEEEPSLESDTERADEGSSAEGILKDTGISIKRSVRTEGTPIDEYLPLLELLERNKERILNLIIPSTEIGKVPRYTVPGIFVTKSVHMTNTLDQLVRDYSKEKNITQRDIFAVALIEFFRRYGYEQEIQSLLGRT